MYLCLMYICPDVSKSGGGDVPMSDVSKSAPSCNDNERPFARPFLRF